MPDNLEKTIQTIKNQILQALAQIKHLAAATITEQKLAYIKQLHNIIIKNYKWLLNQTYKSDNNMFNYITKDIEKLDNAVNQANDTIAKIKRQQQLQTTLKQQVNLNQQNGMPYSTRQIQKFLEYFNHASTIKKLPRTRNKDGSLRGKTIQEQHQYKTLEKWLGFPNYNSIILQNNSQNSQELVAVFAGTNRSTDSFGQIKIAQNLTTGLIATVKIEKLQYYEQDRNTFKENQKSTNLQQLVTTLFHNNKSYFISNYIESMSLFKYLDNSSLITLEKLEAILIVLKEIKAIQDKGIIHGNLHFNNILYNPNTKQAIIVDFDFAAKANSLDKQAGYIKSPIPIETINSYIAPECQMKRDGYNLISYLWYSSDLYSIGKCLEYALLKFPNVNDNNLLQLARHMSNKDVYARSTIEIYIQKAQDLAQYFAHSKTNHHFRH